MAHLNNAQCSLPGSAGAGELLPRETRDSLTCSLVLMIWYFYCSFLPSLLSLQFVIRTQSSISLPSVIFKLVLLPLMLEDGLFWLLWGMLANSDMNLVCRSSSSHTAARLGGYVIYLVGRNDASCGPFWILLWNNNFYRIFVFLPSFYFY